MSDDNSHDSLEETLRAVAREVTRSIERISEVDVDDLARSAGVDPERAKDWFEDAGEWLRVRVGQFDALAFGGAQPSDAGREAQPADVAAARAGEDPLRGAGPHPLDLPTAEQGLALAALDSGRWTIEPGTSALAAHGDGPGPRDALGLVRELRVRDWLDVDGELTITGRHALGRWLLVAERR